MNNFAFIKNICNHIHYVEIFFSVTSVKCENCHEVLFSSSKKDVPKEKLIEPAEVTVVQCI